MSEDWRVVPGFPSYAVSNQGRVKRILSASGKSVDKLRKLGLDTDGYLQVGIYNRNVKKMAKVHFLVLLAFVGPRPDGKVVNHIDGIKVHNWVENLEYCTVQENTIHAYRNGLVVAAHGERHGQSKLTERDVLEIRRRAANGEVRLRLAEEFGVGEPCIDKIVWRQRWSWLK